MPDADGTNSAAAQEADATDQVTRNTKSETTAASYTTTDHEVIRAWAEARNGRPAKVADTEDSSGSGVLRIEFDSSDDRLDESDWDTFFKVFDDRGLAFVYQEKTSDGSISRFNKLIST
jgi:phosphoenolpyruvate-protein kinase (PTS system EI component)